MSTTILKVTRILVYKGNAEFIKSCLEHRGVKDEMAFDCNGYTNTITEAFLGVVPKIEVLSKVGINEE